MNIFKTFLLSMLNLILLPILVINFMVVLSQLGVDWGKIFTGFAFDVPLENTYFGFSSFLIALERFPVVNTLYNGLSTLFGTWTTIVDQIYNYAVAGGDILDVLRIIANFLISPVTILADALKFTLLLLSDILQVFLWFVMLIGGKFNLPYFN